LSGLSPRWLLKIPEPVANAAADNFIAAKYFGF